MKQPVVARWRSWSGDGMEHLVLREEANDILAEAVILGGAGSSAFAVRYRILCDGRWRTRRLDLRLIGGGRRVDLTSDAAGNWADGSGLPLADLRGAADIDLSATPFTNTLPIRRLALPEGRSAEILAARVRIPELTVTLDRQRYVCLERGRRYRYEAADGGFAQEIEVDGHGLALTYSGLFRRLL